MIEFASGATVVKFLYGEDIMDKKIIILDTGNVTRKQRYWKHGIKFTSGAEVVKFL